MLNDIWWQAYEVGILETLFHSTVRRLREAADNRTEVGSRSAERHEIELLAELDRIRRALESGAPSQGLGVLKSVRRAETRALTDDLRAALESLWDARSRRITSRLQQAALAAAPHAPGDLNVLLLMISTSSTAEEALERAEQMR